MLKPEQIRGARAMLGLTQAEVAKRAGISTTGLNNIERGFSDPKASTLTSIQQVLEAAGVEFIPQNGGGAGVRMRAADIADTRAAVRAAAKAASDATETAATDKSLWADESKA